MKDGSGLVLGMPACDFRDPPQAAGRTKLELRVRHTRVKLGERQHGGGFSPRVILKARAMVSGRAHAQ